MADFDWGPVFQQGSELVFDFAKAKLAAEVRPPAPGAAPYPYRPGRSNSMPVEYYDAQGGDIGLMLSDIFSSPRTWVGLAAITVLVVVLVKLRK